MKKFWKCLPFLGAALILAAAALLLLPSIRGNRAGEIAAQLEQRIPQRTTGYEGIYSG